MASTAAEPPNPRDCKEKWRREADDLAAATLSRCIVEERGPTDEEVTQALRLWVCRKP